MLGKALTHELRTLRVLVLHPPGPDRDELSLQLRRIGCQVRAGWPIPETIAQDINIIICLIDDQTECEWPWNGRRPLVPVIAIIQFESPNVLRNVLESGATGIIGKPIRAFGTLTSLVLSRTINQYQSCQDLKIDKLKETLRTRRVVERAVRILSKMRGISDEDAYNQIRQQSNRKRISMSDICASIIQSSDFLFESEPSKPSSRKPSEVYLYNEVAKTGRNKIR